MRKRIRSISVIAALYMSATVTVAQTGINSNGWQGYATRGEMMWFDGIPQGAADQLQHLLGRYADECPVSEQEYAALTVALAALRTGAADAARLLEDYVNSYPASPWRELARLAWGDCYFGQHRYAEALKIYRQVGDNTLDNASVEDLLYRRGYCLLMLGENDAADKDFAKLKASARYSGPANFYLGYNAYRRGDKAQAVKLLGNAAKNPETKAAASLYLAQIMYADGNFQSAYENASASIQCNPGALISEARRIAGESLYQLGRSSEAVPLLWMYVDAAPEHAAPSAYYILGVDEYNKGEYDNAVKLLRKATSSVDVSAQSAWLYMGNAHMRLGNNESALMAYDKAARLDFNPEITETAAYNYAVAGSRGARLPFAGSVRLFEDFLSHYPSSRYASDVRSYIISGYMADNNYEGALTALAKMPSGPETEASLQKVRYTLGVREYNSANYSKALPYLKAAASSTSDNQLAMDALLWHGMCEQALGQYANAAASASKWLKGSPKRDTNRGLALYNLGYAQFADGQHDKALTTFRQCTGELTVADKNLTSDTWARIGDCLYYKSDFDGAAEAYKKSAACNPGVADYATFQLAMMKGYKNDFYGKLNDLKQLIHSYPSSPLIPDAMLEQAQSLVSVGSISEAIDAYSELTQTYPSTPQGRKGLLQRAITHSAAGHTPEAEQDYMLVISSYPTSQEARMAMEDLKGIMAEGGRLGEFTAFLASVPQAPTPERHELDELTFEAAERHYINTDDTSRLDDYLRQYPDGRYEAQALYYKAQFASHSGQYAEAAEIASRIMTKWPDAEVTIDAMLVRAESEAALGHNDAALRIYKDLEQRAGSPAMLLSARNGIVTTGVTTGSYADALEAADKIFASTAAGDPPRLVAEYRAQALQGLGRTTDAIWQWREVLKSGVSDLPGARASVHLADALIASEQSQEAKGILDRFIDSQSPNIYWTARAFILLSDIIRANGDDFEADEYLKSLQSNYPGTEQDIFEMINNRLAH